MLQHISNYQLEKVLRLVHHTQTILRSGGNRTLIIFSYNSTEPFVVSRTVYFLESNITSVVLSYYKSFVY